ncbi:MAG: FG-GAP repeat domain-containing protein [Planctomycetota bacterium]|jgi:hypothetical protein
MTIDGFRRPLMTLAVACASSGASGQLARVQTIEAGAPLPVIEIADIDGDDRGDLVTIDARGVVRVWARGPSSGGLTAAGTDIVLPDPQHALVAIADLLATGSGRQLVVASPEGVQAWSPAPEGGFGGEPVRVAGRASFQYRTRWPRAAGIAPDLNNDGRADLVLPRGMECQVWLSRGEDGDARLEQAGVFAVSVGRDQESDAEHLSDELREQFTLPALAPEDVNGDGRPDLVLGEEPLFAFHVQRPDGVLPAEPDVRLDLRRFRDTTPEPDSMFGGTAVLSDDASWFKRDLDGDDILDYVIAHRRKVWVFHGTSEGPQFNRPSKTFMVDEDITYLQVAELNEDGRPDLLIFKLIVPSETELVLGMLGPLTVEARILVIRLPPVATMMRNPQRYIKQFTDALEEIPLARRGDFNGDDRTDVVVIEHEPRRLKVWLGTGIGDEGLEIDRLIREVIFEQEEGVWDLDRMVGLVRWLGDLATASITRDRSPDALAPLRDAGPLALREIRVGDVTGDAGDEILAIYEDAGRATTIDVYGLDGRAP